jgi:hypothetical protein
MPHPRVALAVVTLLAASICGAGAQMILQGPAPGPAPSQGPTFGAPAGSAPTQGTTFGSGTAPAPTGPMMGGPGMMMGAPPQQQAMPACVKDFMPLRSEAEKRAEVLKAGIEKKADRAKLCGLFRNFSEAEEKVVKYAVANQKNCNIPTNAVDSMKKNHAKTAQVRDKVCAPEPVAKPAGPNLGEAIGTTSLPTPDSTRTGGGTFDTLTGNPLSR